MKRQHTLSSKCRAISQRRAWFCSAALAVLMAPLARAESPFAGAAFVDALTLQPTTSPSGGAAPGGASPATAPGEELATRPSEITLGEPLYERPKFAPLGFAGPSPIKGGPAGEAFVPIPDRWRIGFVGDYVQHARGSIWNPYRQNVLKGDYPILDQDKFMILTLVSDTLFEARRLPTPTGVSATNPGAFDFYGSGHQQVFNQNFIFTLELFEGETVYKPRDLEFKSTIVVNYNYVNVDELGAISPNPERGSDRNDEHVAFQELFIDKHIADLSPNYDFYAIRAGIQGFNADFRGFLYNDNNLGVRLLGNYDNGKLIYNLAWFRQLEKDTNSGLNTFTTRDQDVFIANLYREDFIIEGYTAQISASMNYDRGGPGEQYDTNGFLVRPAPFGTINDKEVRAYYLGWAGDGHIGRVNITHQFYQAFGTESFNNVADQEVNINAQFAAVELSYDQDYIRYRTSFLYASGDSNPTDDQATGFDSIFDNPNFAGGGFSFFSRQAVGLTGGGTGLVGRNSIYPSLRTTKEQGQANFVNPGLYQFNVGADIDVTPRTRVFLNASYLLFAQTETLELIQFDDKIGAEIGYDLSIGVQYRPFNTQNVVFTVGAATLLPGNGFDALYNNDTLYSTFFSATFTY